MKRFLAATAERVAPRTLRNLRKLNGLDDGLGLDNSLPRLISYERELRELRREVDELRRDNRRVAELYDVFFEWAHQNAAQNGGTPRGADPSATVKRVADVLSENL